MKKLLMILSVILLLGSNVATYMITKASVKPETIIVKQEVEIVKYKYKLKEAEIKEKERLLISIPFTKVGISKDFTIGSIFGYALKALAVL